MKQFRLLLTILTLLVVGSMNVYAEIKTWTLSYSDFNSNSYASNNGEHTKDGITYFSNQVMLQSSSMQFQKNKGYIYNKTPMPGNITKITLGTTTNFTIYVGTTASPSSGTVVTSGAAITGNYTYFYIKNGNATAKTATITITYEAAASCTTPAFTIADKTISLSEAKTGEYDMSTNLTINKGGSTGAITYSCDNPDVDVTGGKFNTFDAGTYTINATMAADATYCEATKSFTITVQSAPCTQLEKPTGLNTTNVTATSAELSWTAVPNATKYLVTYSDANVPGSKQENATATTYTLTNLTPSTQYSWSVKAIGDGTTYCDSKDSQTTGGFTTAALPKYTITWSMPDGTSTTQEVTQGNAIGTLHAAPTSCSSTYTNFVGWFTEAAGSDSNPSTAKPATQVTAATVPTGDATYYAVFSDATGDGTLEKATSISNGDVIYLATSPTGEGVTGANTNNKDATVSSTVSEWMPFTVKTVTDGFTLLNGTQGVVVASKSFKLGETPTSLTFNSDGYFTFTVSGTAYCLFKQQTFYRCYAVTQIGTSNYTQFFMYKVGSSATGYISSCCNDPAVVTVTPATTTINLGENGKATTTVTCTQQNGGTAGTWTYSVSPSTATFDGTNFVATAAGEYTLTATYTENCGKSGTATITVTNTPVLYFPTTPTDPIVFGTVECGGNTPLENKQSISLRGYNLTGDVTVTVTGAYKIADTESAAWEDYATSLMLQKDAVSGSSASVYVISTPPMQSSNSTTGKVTFTTAGGNTLEVNLSTPIITCTEYTLTLNDRGTPTSAENYRAGASVPKPTDPTGVCTEPINYVFDGWATAEVAEGSTAYTKVSFPYTMPAANTTLYAVYKYTDSEATQIDGYVLTTELPSAGDSVVIAAKSTSDAWYALKASAENTVSTLSVTDNVAKPLAQAFFLESNGNNLMLKAGSNYVHFNNKELKVTNSTSNAAFNLTADNGMFFLTRSDNQRWMSVSSTANSVTFGVTSTSVSEGNFYIFKKGQIQPYFYTTSPDCSPFITGTQDIIVTSAKGIWVEAVTKLKVECQNLTRNSGGPTVSITAKSLTDGFYIKKSGTTGEGTAANNPLSLVTNHRDDTYSTDLVVVYKPTQDNVIEEGKIALRVYQYSGSTDYATDTVIVRGRSLPAEFVLAAKTASGWVALPADLGTSATDAVKEPYTIFVDDDAAPTKATLAPQSALYSAAMRSTVNAIPTGLRFAAGGKYLQGSESTTTNVWLSSNNSVQMQSWELHSSNLTDYFVRLRAAGEGRYLSYNATQGKIANYKQESRLRILPVEQTCMRYDAPNIRVHALISTSVTFVWEAIAGVTDYEYSLDNEQTWQTCSGSETLGTEVKWTLANLTSETKYTVYIRAKVADGKSNCSVSDSETFTTPTCDDVPVDLWVSPTANAATIMWSAKAPTATVKIYADEQGNKVVKETSNATTPCKITGLEQNTNYYYQVLAGGSCASAIAHFKTESNEVSIVEWKKDALIVDLNTEVTDADEVSILVENQHTHGTNNQNIADDLFFSKYYEATGNVKLVAIYNGTKDTLPLTNVQIKIGKTTWDKTIQMSQYGKYKSAHIAPDEEIILWCKGNSSVDKEISDCVAGKMDIEIMKENDNVVFGGQASIGLFRADTLIDMIGAGTKYLPKGGTIKPSWGDDPGWLGSGYDIENPSTEIELSTNRCLLVRGNKVKSGRNAVLNDTTTFATFTKDEWLGRQVSKYKEDGTDDKGKESSCNGFAYVADFNYNDYYTTYDSIANLEIKGNRNEDGTYTIPVLKLDTMACTNLRLQLKKKGTIQATREEKVPIIIYTTTDTKNSTFFGGKLTDEICKTCDVVVRDNAQLSHIAGGKQQFRDMYVYTGSSLNIPENQTMSLDKVRMFATNDSVSYAIVNNSNDAAAAISVKEVSHVKRIDGRYWYPFSLPYDCNIADIDQLNGQPLGTYGTDWGIKYYDGRRRQSEGNSTTHYGEVSKYWTMVPADGQLKAYTGYIIGLFVPAADEPLMKSVNFPPATESAYTEDASSKTTPITNWPDNLTAKPRHHGWNFVGSPYISLFGSNNNTQDEGLYNPQVQMGWTDALGNQKDKGNIYVSIPDGGNTNTYTQALASGVTIKPFSAYFVQAIDPTNGQSNTLDLTYSKSQRRLPTSAPARTAKTDALILTELDITNGALGDNTGVLVSNVYSAEYEIGDDLTKMYAAAQKPQLYTIDVHNDKMAYQALPDVLAHAIPLGIYVPQAGNYTLSLNRYVSRLEAAEAVYLLHNGAVVANLLLSDYTVAASAKGTISGYSLDIRRAPEVVTDIVPAAGDAPYIIARDGVLAIANLPADAVVQVYDVLGHRLLQTDTHAAGTLQVPVPQTGVYTVVITTADGQQVLKTLLR